MHTTINLHYISQTLHFWLNLFLLPHSYSSTFSKADISYQTLTILGLIPPPAFWRPSASPFLKTFTASPSPPYPEFIFETIVPLFLQNTCLLVPLTPTHFQVSRNPFALAWLLPSTPFITASPLLKVFAWPWPYCCFLSSLDFLTWLNHTCCIHASLIPQYPGYVVPALLWHLVKPLADP